MGGNAEFLKWSALVIFACGFASFLFFEKYRHWLAVIAALLVVGLRLSGVREAILSVNWQIIGIFAATLVAAEVFMLSGAAAVAAEAILAKCKRPAWSIIVLCALTGFMSIFIENVACVLIAAPVALSLARKLEMRPQAILVGCALASNLQGCALLVGDPPSMLLAGHAKFTFLDFLWYQGRPSIFFSVQAGAIAGLVFLWFVFRKHRGRVEIERTAKLLGWLPSVSLGGVVAALAVGTQLEKGIGWGAVCGTGVCALVALGWYLVVGRRYAVKGESMEDALLEHKVPGVGEFFKGLDWKTTMFLIAIFVPVAALEKYGWVGGLGGLIGDIAQNSRLAAFVILVTTAVVVSAFVDNVPFLLVMLPAVSTLAEGMGITGQPVFLYFGLLLGASVGGNITPVGAQANITAVGFLRKHGEPIGLREYVKLSLPYTIVAVAVACLFTYLSFGVVPPGQ